MDGPTIADAAHPRGTTDWWSTGRCLALGAACLLLVFFFHQPPGWNGNSRLLTVYALVEDGTLHADRWRGLTGDYAEVNGHIVSDKAPLSSFVVTPFYWLWRHGKSHPQGPAEISAALHLADLVACAVPFALLSMIVFRRVASAGASRRQAVWLTLAAMCASPLFCYGAQYLGNVLSSMLFLGAYILAVDREDRFDLAGLLGGLAVTAEYPLALPNAILLGYLALGPDGLRRSARYLVGALGPALLLLAYNRTVTGHFFDLPYAHENSAFAQMHHGFGMVAPDLAALWELVFGQYRGLLFYAPLLLVWLPVLWLGFDGSARRRVLVFALIASQLLFVSSYFMWWGGYCVGPRHLALAMVLAMFEGMPAVARRPRLFLLFGVLAAWGVAIEVLAVSTDALPHESWHAPVFEVFVPHFLSCDINAHNLLVEIGLRNGRYILAVWVALFAALGLLLGEVGRARSPSPVR